MPLIAMLCTSALLCSGGNALAQTIHKKIDAAGRTIFTDQPELGTDEPEERATHRRRNPESPRRISTGAWSDVERALNNNVAMTSTDAATIDFNEAQRRLKQAREARREGMKLRPGERTDGAGTSAMDKRYQERKRKLDREVAAAERRLRETARARDAVSGGDGRIDRLKVAQP
jgi:hypothetical protein